MTVIFIRDLNSTGIAAPTAGIKVIRSPTGPAGTAGAAAAIGLVFAWPGLVIGGEPAQGYPAPAAGHLGSTNVLADFDPAHPATADSTFALKVDGISAGTVTFHPDGSVTAAVPDLDYALGAYIQAVPPAVADATLQGAAIVLT